jgi:hypothetical protein
LETVWVFFNDVKGLGANGAGGSQEGEFLEGRGRKKGRVGGEIDKTLQQPGWV